MRVSFALAVADDAPRLRACLEGVAACARPGDQVIVVDAGSHDGGDRIARAFLAAAERDPGVEWTPIELGDGARGRPGIADRVGMEAATRDAILPLRGADRLRFKGFARTLRAARESGADLILANYLDGDHGAPGEQADAALWTVPAGALPDRVRAVRHACAPRRKLLRRGAPVMAALGAAPEDGIADATFHWRVSMAAKRIAFVDAPLVHHGTSGPGEEAAPGGCFDAYDAIRRDLPPGEGALGRAALDWLLGCVSRDLERIGAGTAASYAVRGAASLGAVPDAVWDAAGGMEGPEVRALAGLLRRGDVAAAVAALQGAATAREVAALREALAGVAGDARAGRAATEAVAAAMRFEALRALAPEAS